MKYRTFILPLGLLLSLLVSVRDADAQTFGKNKVQYTDFNWLYIQSSHFDVYFSDGGYDIAVFTAKAAEDALKTIQSELRYKISSRIPFIVYNSHNDFQQTNVVGSYLEEGIGGVTELFKNRIVIPFEGSYKNFRHVIHHELVHAVINDMFYGGSIQALIAGGGSLQLPLWFNEGLAEYLAQDGWDHNSDMFLRDASTSNYLPPIHRLYGYFAYRGGQSVWWYIAEKYGKKKVGEIVNRVRTTSSIDLGLKNSIGLTLEELSERWSREQKVLYYPDVAARQSPESYAKRLTNHSKLKNFYNTSPAMSPNGERIAFISDRDDFFSIYVMNSDGGDAQRVIEGQTSKDFEELHLLTPGLTWSPDSRSIAFSAKAGAADAIYIIDVETGKQQRLPIAMDGIFTVEWSPAGDKIAFIGNSSKQSDLWIYDLTTKKDWNLTSDVFTDSQPAWSPDGQKIYFTSDRGNYVKTDNIPEAFDIYDHEFSQMDVYYYDLETNSITRITDTPGISETFPIASPDGEKLLYISDKNGINNVYIHHLGDHTVTPVTNSISGVYQLSLSRDASKLAFASMYEAGFDIFLLKTPLSMPNLGALELTEYKKRLKKSPLAASTDTSTIRDTSDVGLELKDYSKDIAIQLGSTDVKDGNKESEKLSEGRMTFADSVRAARKRNDVFAVKNNVDDEGNFVPKKYKLSFSPDLVYGNAGYNTFYGVLGSTQMAFSDILGDHQIYLVTNLLGDLKNSDYALAYLYLPDRIDWGIQAFHSARFLWGEGLGTIDLYRYRQYGGGLYLSYPFDRFNRLEGSLTVMNISQENLDDPRIPSLERTITIPNVAYVHDHTLWGMWAPVKGNRYEVRLFGSPGLGGKTISFASLSFDYRQYYKFGEDISFVLRGSGGASFGANPQRFFVGGTENWINREFEEGRIPIDNVEDFAFLTPALPLRGYNYNARIGTKYFLGNMELRFPLVKYFLGGVLPFILQTMNGAVFVDMGGATNDWKNFQAYHRDENGDVVSKDLLVGTGLGTRMWLLGLPVKFDVGWAFTGSGFSKPKYYFSLGAEF